MQKLRSIVHESERRSEGYRDKMNEMLVDRERMQTELERLLQDSRKLVLSAYLYTGNDITLLELSALYDVCIVLFIACHDLICV